MVSMIEAVIIISLIENGSATSNVIECDLFSGLFVQHFQKPLTEIVICGTGSHLYLGYCNELCCTNPQGIHLVNPAW